MNDRSAKANTNDRRAEVLLREYVERVRRGESVDFEAFISQHPDVGDELRTRALADKQLIATIGWSGGSGDPSKGSVANAGFETVPPRDVDRRSPRSLAPALPERFGRYRIIRALGRGAMGTVYLAEDTQLGRQVALKTPHFEDDPTGELVARFYREAQSAATLRHANICPVFDVGQIDGKHYITMAYIEGRPLSTFIHPDKPQTERQILIAVRKLALAIQEAHEHGIIHRDLKPSNIMVDKRGEPIVMDFGLAQQARTDGDIRLTQSGVIIGTPAYMSPEQVEGDLPKIGPATDQYSLGVILYELLTGDLPFSGSMAAVMGQIITKEPPPPSKIRPDLDLRIESACQKMMAKDPAQRFASLGHAANELAEILKHPSRKRTALDNAKQPSADVAATPEAKRESLNQKLTDDQVASLDELARKCYRRHDYEQVLQVVGQIPEMRRTAEIQSLWTRSVDRIDEITYLLAEIDEAIRLNDRRTAQKKVDELLKIKPGHHRARHIETEFAARGSTQTKRAGAGAWRSFTQPWSEGGWIPWSALAFGILVFVGMAFGVNSYLRAPKGVAKSQGEEPQGGEKKPGDVASTPISQPAVVKEPVQQQPTPAKRRPALLSAPFNEGEAKKSQQEWANFLGLPSESTNSIGMELVLIPAGEFFMGSSPDDLEKVAPILMQAQRKTFGHDQAPQHRVKISRAFYLGASEVTRGQFAEFVRDAKYKTDAERDGKGGVGFEESTAQFKQLKEINWQNPGFEQDDRHPVVDVSWNDANAFCEWLSQKEGKTYRLPTEAEWEYACRAGTTTLFSNGDDSRNLVAIGNILDAAWKEKFPVPPSVDIRDGFAVTAPVQSFAPNAFGLFDMHGNVWEICQDFYDKMYYSNSPTNDPTGPSEGEYVVSRGGGFDCPPKYCLSANRSMEMTSERVGNMGFRVACDTLAANKTTDNPKLMWKLAGHTSSINLKIAISPDSRWIVSCGQDSTARIWDVESGRQVHVIEGNDSAAAFVPRGGRLILGHDRLDHVNSLKLLSVPQWTQSEQWLKAGRFVFDLAFNSDGSRMLSSHPQMVKLWEVATGRMIRQLEKTLQPSSQVALTPDGRFAFGHGGNQTFFRWDVESGKLLATSKCPAAGEAALSPDGRTVLFGDWSGGASLLDFSTGKEMRRFGSWNYGRSTRGVAFSADGRFVLAGADDGFARLFDFETAKELDRFGPHREGISSVAFSPNGRFAVTACSNVFEKDHWRPGKDHFVRVWRLPAAGCRRRTSNCKCVDISNVARKYPLSRDDSKGARQLAGKPRSIG